MWAAAAAVFAAVAAAGVACDGLADSYWRIDTVLSLADGAAAFELEPDLGSSWSQEMRTKLVTWNKCRCFCSSCKCPASCWDPSVAVVAAAAAAACVCLFVFWSPRNVVYFKEKQKI